MSELETSSWRVRRIGISFSKPSLLLPLICLPCGGAGEREREWMTEALICRILADQKLAEC